MEKKKFENVQKVATEQKSEVKRIFFLYFQSVSVGENITIIKFFF